MLSLLSNIIEVITFIPDYIMWAIETVWNLFVIAIQAAFTILTLIPLPAEPGTPEYISQINWFFPIGAIISVGAPVLTGYIAFIAIRWLYKYTGNL